MHIIHGAIVYSSMEHGEKPFARSPIHDDGHCLCPSVPSADQVLYTQDLSVFPLWGSPCLTSLLFSYRLAELTYNSRNCGKGSSRTNDRSIDYPSFKHHSVATESARRRVVFTTSHFPSIFLRHGERRKTAYIQITNPAIRLPPPIASSRRLLCNNNVYS